MGMPKSALLGFNSMARGQVQAAGSAAWSPPPTLGNSPIGAQCRFSAASGIPSPEEVLKMRPSLVLATAADRNPAGLVYAGYILSADQACASLEARSVLPLPELFRVFDFSHRHLASTSSWKSLEKGVSPVELKQQQS